MLWAWKRRARPGAWSTLTLTSFTRPANVRARFSRTGLTIRHGPHHGAHRSTMTGSFDRSATSAKSPSPASTTQGNASWQLAQRGVPVAAAGTRFFVPQWGPGTITLNENAAGRPRL